MKLLKKVFKMWRPRKEESGNQLGNNKNYQSNLYGSDDDLGFC